MKRFLISLCLVLFMLSGVADITFRPRAAKAQQAQSQSSPQQAPISQRVVPLEEFKKRFAAIKEMGWVASRRKGSTGIGYTLETLLGISENNVDLPDLGTAELKSHRLNSSSMVTLFTFDKDAWKMNPLAAVRKYGTKDDNGRMNLFYTLSATPTATGLFLHITTDAVSIRHLSGEVLAEWSLSALAQQFQKKMPALVFVSALSEMRGDVEYFKYMSARLLSGTSPELLRAQLQSGNLSVDLRIHERPTSARNHGTAFRTHAHKLLLLFSSITEL